MDEQGTTLSREDREFFEREARETLDAPSGIFGGDDLQWAIDTLRWVATCRALENELQEARREVVHLRRNAEESARVIDDVRQGLRNMREEFRDA